MILGVGLVIEMPCQVFRVMIACGSGKVWRYRGLPERLIEKGIGAVKSGCRVHSQTT